jgi:3-phosphoshikimate 1-carboxyvinyltransferase
MHNIINKHSSIDCKVSLPLSKSIINRLLVVNHLSGGSAVSGFETEASDVQKMLELLKIINSKTRNPEAITEINVGNAGTVMRFLTALLAISPGKWRITGSERMQQRPVKPLTDALQSLGAELSFEKNEGYPPILIHGNATLNGGRVQVNSGISSQFISALMMIGPKLNDGISIELIGEMISGSYIRMTEAILRKAGIQSEFIGNTLKISGKYSPFDFQQLVEPDWSAAAFWFEIAALATEATLVLEGLRPQSVQGDSVLPEIFNKLGVKSEFIDEGLLITKSDNKATGEFIFDFTNCPDLAQAVIVTCAALGVKGKFTGLKTLRVKETDRIEAIQTELKKLGYTVEVVNDQIILPDNQSIKLSDDSNIIINCYDDHRMAMSFAPLALLHDKISLDEPEVVKKSYPEFWKELEKAGLFLSDE